MVRLSYYVIRDHGFKFMGSNAHKDHGFKFNRTRKIHTNQD
jgi:hypothetical protein